MFICIIDKQGTTIVHKNIPTDSECFLNFIAPFSRDIAIRVHMQFLGRSEQQELFTAKTNWAFNPQKVFGAEPVI